MMNAFRKSRVMILFALVALVALGLSVAPAEAGGHKHGHHGHHFHKHHFKHFHFGHHYPIYKHVAKPVVYPVTYYDCYGQPYVVWQTSYQTVPYLGY